MKVYISADIEGTAGITHWDEAEKGKLGYDLHAEYMTREVIAACEGAFAAGATDVVVKDAHWTARNIIADRLPEQVRLIRGWSGHPWSMIQEIDGSFDALAMTGYHSGAGAGGNPLAHTITDGFAKITINGTLANEYLLMRNAAATLGVPTVFISGDQNLCNMVKTVDAGIHTVATSEGVGDSTISIHPNRSCALIAEGVEAALRDDGARGKPALDDSFDVVVRYVRDEDAYRASFYPGASLVDPHEVSFSAAAFGDVMTFLSFVHPSE